jgi:hypothetical protein
MIAVALALVIVTVGVLWRYSRKRQIKRLEKSIKVVFTFAGIGFLTAWLLLAVYSIARYLTFSPSTTPLLYLCPSSIIALGLDNASLLVGLFGWLVISITNALLYSIVGMVVGAALFPVWKLD